MNLRKILLGATLAVVTTGCSTAGPFVTSISSDGRGNLIVEKSHIRYNSFTGTVSNIDPMTTTVSLMDLEEYRRLARTTANRRQTN